MAELKMRFGGKCSENPGVKLVCACVCVCVCVRSMLYRNKVCVVCVCFEPQ